MIPPSYASVFVGWLEQAEVIQVRLPGGNVVTYSGEKLKNVAEELKEWEKYAEKKATKKDRPRDNNK